MNELYNTIIKELNKLQNKTLKIHRLLNNLSLREVGQKLNISATAVKKYEDNIIIPNSAMLIKFAKIYKVGIPDLLKICKDPLIEFGYWCQNKVN